MADIDNDDIEPTDGQAAEALDPDATALMPVLDTSPDHATDWIEAADSLDSYLDDPRMYAHNPEWAVYLHGQMGRALWYLGERASASASDLEAVARRAAIILNAEPEAPEIERMLGIRIATHLEGQEVKCRLSTCRLRYTCLPEDPYYDATTRANGLCGRCVLLETRTDAAVAVLTGKVVTPAKRTRKEVTDGK